MLKKIISFILFFTFSFLYADTPILIIHSYHETYPWSASQNKGFRNILDKDKTIYPLYSTEYLDSKRRGFDKDYEAEFVRYINSKYKGYKPKLIYVTDDNAFEFILNIQKELFPNIPIVFSGVNDISKKNLINDKKFSGIFETKGFTENIELVRTLFPKEKEILFLSDDSTTARIVHNEMKSIKSKTDALNIQTISGDNYETTLNQLKNYKGKIILLATVGGFKTQEGDLVPLKQFIEEIINIGNFTVFALEDTYIQQGVIGGFVNDGVFQGEKAGEIALKILKNPKENIPESIDSIYNLIFDFKALKYYGITLPKELAKKSQFLNPELTFIQKYEQYIIIGIYGLISIIILGGIFFTQYLYSSRKTILQREEALEKMTNSLDKAQAVAHLGHWDWNIKNNTLWWSDEIYRIFGLEPQEFKATYEAFIEHVHPDDVTKVQEAVNRSLNQNIDYHIVHRILRKDGQERHVLEEGTLKLDKSGEPLNMIGIVHDITGEYKKEMALLLQAEIFNSVQDSIMVHDIHGHFIYLNENAWKTRGYSEEEMMKLSVKELDAPEYGNDPKRMEEVLKKIQEEGYIRFQVEHLCKNGDRLPVEIYSKLITLEEKTYFLSSVRDITNRKKSQAVVEKLSKVIEQVDDSVVITDKEGTITYVNKAFCEHTGYSKEDVLGESPRLLKSDKHDKNYYENLWTTILRGDIFREIMLNKKKNGDIYYEKKTITPLKDDMNNLIGFVSTGKDVTSETIMHQEIEKIASTDKLTGVYNRHKFEELFVLEAERSRRFDSSLSLILIDIDYFKDVNDTYGHDIGDDILRQLSKVLKDNIRNLDVLARWGGEEFIVLASNTDLDKVRILAEKLRLAIQTFDFPTVKNITISVGISILEKNDSFETLFKRADKALYTAKNNGRNRVSYTT